MYLFVNDNIQAYYIMLLHGENDLYVNITNVQMMSESVYNYIILYNLIHTPLKIVYEQWFNNCTEQYLHRMTSAVALPTNAVWDHYIIAFLLIQLHTMI